jgi:very-short-patch-repair endonuclease
MTLSNLEETFALHIAAEKMERPRREFHFHPTRKWRFDFAWPARMLAVEIDGGEWVRSRHFSAKTADAEREKTIAADRLGWTVLHFTGSQVRSGEAIAQLKSAMEDHPVV